MIVIDASAIVELLTLTRRGRTVADRILPEQGVIHAPHLIDLEVASVLRRLELTDAISPRAARKCLETYSQIGIKRWEHIRFISSIWELRHNLTTYDASYLVLARALDVPLITCDGSLVSTDARVELIA